MGFWENKDDKAEDILVFIIGLILLVFLLQF